VRQNWPLLFINVAIEKMIEIKIIVSENKHIIKFDQTASPDSPPSLGENYVINKLLETNRFRFVRQHVSILLIPNSKISEAWHTVELSLP